MGPLQGSGTWYNLSGTRHPLRATERPLMPPQTYKVKYMPYRILAHLYFHPHGFYTDDLGAIKFKTRQLANLLLISNEKFYGHLEWLWKRGYIDMWEKPEKGWTRVRLLPPQNRRFIPKESVRGDCIPGPETQRESEAEKKRRRDQPSLAQLYSEE